MNDFYKVISEIGELSEISEVAWHTIDDEPTEKALYIKRSGNKERNGVLNRWKK